MSSILFRTNTGETWQEDYSFNIPARGLTTGRPASEYDLMVQYDAYTGDYSDFGFEYWTRIWNWLMVNVRTETEGDVKIAYYQIVADPNIGGSEKVTQAIFQITETAGEETEQTRNSVTISQPVFTSSITANPSAFSNLAYNYTGTNLTTISYNNIDINTLSAITDSGWITASFGADPTKTHLAINCTVNTDTDYRVGSVAVVGLDYAGRTVSKSISVQQNASPSGSIEVEGPPAKDEVPWDDDDEYSVTCTYTDIDISTVQASANVDWVELEWEDDEVKDVLLVTFARNTGENNRVAIITVSGTDNYTHNLSDSVSFTQYGQPLYPIWRDVYYTATVEDKLDYYVTKQINNDDEEVIYSGRAYLMPGHSNVKVNISKICQDYLNNNIDDGNIFSGSTLSNINEDAVHTFHLYDGEGNELDYYIFRYDWSYKPLSIYTTITNPINGHSDGRMRPLVTHVVDNSYYRNLYQASSYTTGYCGDYALYYLQRNGGWAAFLIEGNVKKKDSYEKYSYNMSFDNNKAEFEENTYHLQLTTTWSLSTGWLSDAQSENLAFNLLPSNRVFMHDLKEGKIIPVVITNSEAEYKTFKTNGRKMVNYTIEIRESQKKQSM